MPAVFLHWTARYRNNFIFKIQPCFVRGFGEVKINTLEQAFLICIKRWSMNALKWVYMFWVHNVQSTFLLFESKESITNGVLEGFSWSKGFLSLYRIDFKHICLEILFQGKRSHKHLLTGCCDQTLFSFNSQKLGNILFLFYRMWSSKC